ncbi:hypothetical protein PENTCL1PPCAC_8778 [Pristionchus entomophagus]|uniref:Uncharacterized protein n=1 Tax=Pristionchus entomophagus TaxID=358040 RepID=A0AAV5SXA3_9BILA|nr:hypothetical protein PENTCL1PPCAC_8778 [Pristionchus entomophagus]
MGIPKIGIPEFNWEFFVQRNIVCYITWCKISTISKYSRNINIIYLRDGIGSPRGWRAHMHTSVYAHDNDCSYLLAIRPFLL